MTIEELIKELSDYPKDTRIDFVLLGEDWEDSFYDTPLDIKGVVGSGETDVKYIELGLYGGIK
tara:strand:+ start:169 stop:357 length:189 start_codon:yes stop_codon:yes gene_type:complete